MVRFRQASDLCISDASFPDLCRKDANPRALHASGFVKFACDFGGMRQYYGAAQARQTVERDLILPLRYFIRAG